MSSAWGYSWGRAWRNAWGTVVAVITLPAPERIARPGVEGRRLALAQARRLALFEGRLATLRPVARVARVTAATRVLPMPPHQRAATAPPELRRAALAESRVYRLHGSRTTAPRELRRAIPAPDSRAAAGVSA